MSDARSSGTFFSKSETVCPVCSGKFYKEDIMTGGGRLNAGDLTEELRRLYIPTKKYGEVNPLIYYIIVCPSCFFAASQADFNDIKSSSAAELNKNKEERKKAFSEIVPDLDFRKPRTLIEGVASYFYAVMCLEHFPADMSPSIKGGVYCLRAAWLCNDLHSKMPNDNYDYMASVFYRKARFYYIKALQGEHDGTEGVGGMKNPGPDLDKNYGYDGVLYIAAYLQYKYYPTEDHEKRMQALTDAKRIVARIFGMGKASKNKPAAILDNAKTLFDKIKEELKESDE